MGPAVSIPGPGAIEWSATLLVWAGFAALIGEFLRAISARFVPLWQRPEPIERALVDFFLGGAVLYAVAVVPWHGFVGPVVELIPLLAAIGVAFLAVRSVRRPGGADRLRRSLAPLGRPAYIVVMLSALSLFLVEVATAASAGTGNTYDSSLFTTYTSLLLQSHTTPLSFAPYASTGLLYPQGTTVWLGWAQLLLGPPPARAALLVTPLFFGMAPLAGFVFGRRLFGREPAGLAMALVLAWIGAGTRGMVFGSNDFVVAFPLVLVLAGQAVVWLRSPVPRLGDALAFGVLCGYSAAMNPVGAEWLLLALPVMALLARPRFAGHVRAWFARWAVSVVTALVGVVPSLYVLLVGRSSPEFVPGATAAPAGIPTGIPTSQFIGAVDPFLFGSSDTGLSTVAALRLELAVLIAVGLAILLLVGRDSGIGRYLEPFRTFVAGAGCALIGLLGLFWAASSGFGPAVDFANVSSVNELSVSLFTVYAFIAGVPLALALERFAGWLRRTDPIPPQARRPSSARPSAQGLSPTASRAVVPLVIALVIVVPGVVLTPTALPPTLSGLYHDFGNVTAADFDLFAYAGAHLPVGARVLVAPGSAGEFLPGYCANLVLLYPMVPEWQTINASYERLVQDLPNATLGPADLTALSDLRAGFVVVTGNSTTLWPAFSPKPFLANPAAYDPLFAEGDAYLFAVVG